MAGYKHDIPIEARTSITNLDTGNHIYLQYEPLVITSSVAANYNSDPAIGGTHENLIFSHTSNETFSFEVRWNRISLTALTGKTTDRADMIIDHARAFLRSLVNPKEVAGGVVTGDTPLLNVKVPGVFDVIARMVNIDGEASKRDRSTGALMEFTMRCTFKEDPTYRWSSEDIFNAGYDRS